MRYFYIYLLLIYILVSVFRILHYNTLRYEKIMKKLYDIEQLNKDK